MTNFIADDYAAIAAAMRDLKAPIARTLYPFTKPLAFYRVTENDDTHILLIQQLIYDGYSVQECDEINQTSIEYLKRITENGYDDILVIKSVNGTNRDIIEFVQYTFEKNAKFILVCASTQNLGSFIRNRMMHITREYIPKIRLLIK